MEDHGRDTGFGRVFRENIHDKMETGGAAMGAPSQGQDKKLMDGFGTGATRSTAADAIDFEGHISPEVLQLFGEYMHTHRIQADGNVRASDNWQKGIPLHSYLKSLLRHTFDLWLAWRGVTTYDRITKQPQTIGDLGAAIIFNVQGFLFELIRVEGLKDGMFPATKWHYVTKKQRQRVEQYAEKLGNKVLLGLPPVAQRVEAIVAKANAEMGWKHPGWEPSLPAQASGGSFETTQNKERY